MIPYVKYSAATATHRQILLSMKRDLGRLLEEKTQAERREPLELLGLLRQAKLTAQAGGTDTHGDTVSTTSATELGMDSSNVGQFQVSEMIGERWGLVETAVCPYSSCEVEDFRAGHTNGRYWASWLRQDYVVSQTQ